MKLARYIPFRIAAIVLLFFIFNEIYYRTFWKSDVHTHSNTLEKLWEVDKNADAIYFGESSNFNRPNNEAKTHRISDILDTLVPENKIETVNSAGIHAGTYLSLIQNLPKNNNLKFLVITMNLRSFGCVWIKSEFETNLSKAECLIKPSTPKLWNRFMLSLNEYDLKSKDERYAELLTAFKEEKFEVPNLPFTCIKEWDDAIANKQWHGPKPFKDQDEISLACHYVKNYAFAIDTKTNPRIKDFDNIVKWGKENNCKIIFNILGENIEEADVLIGSTLTDLMRENTRLLMERYTKMGAIVIDNLDKVPDSCFVDRDWPTEHYSLRGKQIVAVNLSRKINKLKF